MLHGCAATDYVDQSAAAGVRTVSFGGVAYTPRCLTIAAGQSVSFSGSFAAHPLRGGLAPGQTGTATTPNPIANTDTGSTAAFTFATPGFYPFYCNVHFASGMTGVVQVR